MITFMKAFAERVRFWNRCDRIGPEIPWTHWRLYFKPTMLKLCTEKFKYFAPTADFRPGAYAVGCSKISIGHNVIIRPGVCLHGNSEGEHEIIIEDEVLLAQGVHIYVDNHRFDDIDIPILYQGHLSTDNVMIKQGTWIGANAIILPGVTIGTNSVIGAGSVVSKNIPDGVVAAGNPVKIIRERK